VIIIEAQLIHLRCVTTI